MTARFAALRDDGIDSRLLKRGRLLDGGLGSDQKHAAIFYRRDHILWQNAEREAEDRRAAFENRAQLFVERVRKQCRDDRRRQAQFLEERRDALQRRLGISGHVGRALRRETAHRY